MALGVGVFVQRIGSWFTNDQAQKKVLAAQPIQDKPMQDKSMGTASFGWGALDKAEEQRVRKVGADLIKFQSINRGY